ncbi:GNAT family N-acetyltransferase [Planctomyces sp. SH-PL14]|uniref:GNAT family N-acetyltransferase n=1 Tax=Planctomyces sp. SH-PL14 TaxID=1632864 RepID=UPI0018D31730|nr:GNAT family N-acetyltransferase [Planctomyces sp. SH-PL14]
MSPDTPVTSSATALLCPAAILMIRLRPYRPDDGPRLLHLFRDTIRRVNIRDYPASQITAWASDEIDASAWCRRFEDRFVVVAEDSSEPPRVAGFAELEPDGHIDRVYVSADHQRQGVGRAMLQAILAEAERQGLERLFVEASLTALPFFESLGFSTIARQTVECRGERLVNVRMEWLRSETL